MKRIILSFTLLLSAFTLFGQFVPETIYLPEHIQASKDSYWDTLKKRSASFSSPEATMFGFDLHDVLLKRHITELVWQMASGKGISLAAKMLAGKLGWKNEVSEGFRKVKSAGGSAEGYAAHFEEKDPELAQLIRNLGDTYGPMDGMQELVEELQNKKYETVLASDIALNMLKRAREKDSLKELLGLLPRAQVVSYTGDSSFEEPISVSPTQKPNDKFFELFAFRFNPDNKYIIFVDDREKNVIAAQKNGMVGILFRSPEQLRKDLQTLGILSVETA